LEKLEWESTVREKVQVMCRRAGGGHSGQKREAYISLELVHAVLDVQADKSLKVMV
jgi:hypothetical protein